MHPDADIQVPQLDLAGTHRALRPEIEGAMRAVLSDGRFVGGPVVEAFEDAWAAYCGVDHGIGVGNGTDALEITLAALGIARDAEVIVPALTYAATAEAVVNAGARPVFVDVLPTDFSLDPAATAAAVSPRTAAIVAVHLYGQPADMAALRRVADAHHLALIEDAAQAHGAAVGDRRVGGLADAACFSFYPSKNLGALGDAGAIVTADAGLAERARTLRDHGQAEPGRHTVVGRNSRLDALQAAVLTVKLPHLDRWNAGRAAVAARYDAGLGAGFGIAPPARAAGRTHAFHQYVVCVAEADRPGASPAAARDAVAAHLAGRGIETRVHYRTPLHCLPAFAAWARGVHAPVAERAAGRVLSLPMYPDLPLEHVGRVVDALAAAGREARP